MRICFTLQVEPALIPEYRARHAAVWPRMLEEIAAAGRRDYSLFLREDGLLVGVYEVDDPATADAHLAASAVAAEWEADMQRLFAGLEGRPDQSATQLEEIFHLETQLAAARDRGI